LQDDFHIAFHIGLPFKYIGCMSSSKHL